jgi:protein subunit release factor B
MLTFSVSEEKNQWLRERMAALGIREEELEEKFVRSSGKGGQHVNKSSTCVWLRHIPTGIEVKCMAERSQSVNRFLARRELVEKIALLTGHSTPRSLKQEKKQRQKARRQRRSAGKYADAEKIEEGEK